MIVHCHRRGGKRLREQFERQNRPAGRLTALFLCLSLAAGFFPALAAGETEQKLSEIVNFSSITLHKMGAGGEPEEEAVKDGALFAKGQELVLRYTYEITPKQCGSIQADTPYYLEVSPHLVLPNLPGGSELTVEKEDGSEEQFGSIYSDEAQGKAWVTFLQDPQFNTVLAKYGSLEGAYFYLNCRRADEVPPNEAPIAGTDNLYAMKFEDNAQLNFGYEEKEPVWAKASITKDGSVKDKTITWTIDYTPWQNPAASDPVTLDTPFELRDTIDPSLHSYVDGSAEIAGTAVTAYTSRNDIPAGEDAYVMVEPPAEEGGAATLIFGGSILNAGRATRGEPAKPVRITYRTSINETLLLPGGQKGTPVTNAAELFDGPDFHNTLGIKGSKTVTVAQPQWLEKKGTTHRNPGSGSTTDWTVTFKPNGFSFAADNHLTLHDQLPDGSSLVDGSVRVDGHPAVPAVDSTNHTFTVSDITTVSDPAAADVKPVQITYQTSVPESMYDNSTSLGENTAWFTFQYGEVYETPKSKTPVGSGDGSGTPVTASLVKSNTGYHKDTRTIDWSVTINPHKANLQGGTFTDDLKIGDPCGIAGHLHGLELAGAIQVSMDGASADTNLVMAFYGNQEITITVQNVGATAITLAYTTKVCDPCIFANNNPTAVPFKNVISTHDMVLGNPGTQRSISAGSTADVSSTVLTKKPPVYDYATGKMKWTVEVDAAGLSMADVVLTDTLPNGLTYGENSFQTDPAIPDAKLEAQGQDLTITLGNVTQKTAVTFDTWVNPEELGFDGDKAVVVENTICMNGVADGVPFEQVFSSIKREFTNHGLVKSSAVNSKDESIAYQVLINPFRLALPENPSLVDALDSRLQLDTDTLKFYKVQLNGTTGDTNLKPGYTIVEEIAQPPEITGFDPAANSCTVRLPIPTGSRDTYLLTYTADIIRRESGSYGNSVRFEGGGLLLGGGKNNSASVGGGGGGGGGGVAARKAAITVVKTDRETGAPLPGVTFTLYQWDSVNHVRGLPFAQGTTDGDGKLSFLVKPRAFYELVESAGIPGYGSVFGWTNLPDGVTETESGLLIQAGAAASALELDLTNEAHTADIIFRLFNRFGIPMAGTAVHLFKADPAGEQDPVPDMEITVTAEGTVKFAGVRRGAKYFLRLAGGEIMAVTIPIDAGEETKAELPDGSVVVLTADYQAAGTLSEDQQWTLTVTKVVSGSETPLPGASIGLYSDKSGTNLIKSGISGRDGTVVFEGLMAGQSYWVKEIRAPEGYHLNTAVYEGKNEAPAVTVEDEPKAAPIAPIIPDNPGVSENGGTSDDAAAPDKPHIPGISDQPDGSDYTLTPDNPDVTDNPVPSAGQDHGEETGEPSVPKTGDAVPRLAALVLISGVLFGAMALYRLRESKERVKR